MAETVSNAPWSNFKASDYTDEQWLRACLIDRGAEAGTAKQRASLPVREPSGTLNRNGVIAAAGALAGARGGLKNVSAEQKASARKKLLRLYSIIGKEAPESLKHSALDSTGNTTAAIMAIPSPLESIRLVGDEEKHATLLFFGETSTLPGEARQTLLDSVQMACEMLFPFSESITDVVRLGSEVPPALVALLAGENLSQVRNLFMMNPAVKGYQDNVQQHPSFTPHVTLGHPDFTDEAIVRALMRQIFKVRFDRLSVWWNDERFDCPLGIPTTSDDASVSAAIGKFLAEHAVEDDDHLEHHGVKGQKWGVRRAVDSASGLVKKGRSSTPGEPGLIARTGSADQIAQDRIAKKIVSSGTQSLSNADIQAYTRRLQMQKDLDRVLSEQSAAEKAKADGFIKTFVKKQAGRQVDRVVNKALDVAVESALKNAGVKVSDKNPELGKNIQTVAKRLAPKKG